jgi:hypothetical protein
LTQSAPFSVLGSDLLFWQVSISQHAENMAKRHLLARPWMHQYLASAYPKRYEAPQVERRSTGYERRSCCLMRQRPACPSCLTRIGSIIAKSRPVGRPLAAFTARSTALAGGMSRGSTSPADSSHSASGLDLVSALYSTEERILSLMKSGKVRNFSLSKFS